MEKLPVSYCEKEMIWSGAKKKLEYDDDTSAGEIIFNNMRNWPKHVCQICDTDGVTVTFEQALSWAIRMAQVFKKRGLTHKDIIGIVAENSTYLMPLAVACLLNGTPFHSPISIMDKENLKNVFLQTKPGLIFCDGNEYEKVQAATIEWQPEIFTITDHLEGVSSIEALLVPTDSEQFYRPEPLQEGGKQTVAILCSSGTTGPPKCAHFSSTRLISQTLLDCGPVLFSTTSLSWMSGLWFLMVTTALRTTRLITKNPFTPLYILQLVEKYKVSCLSVSPANTVALINFPGATAEVLTSIRYLLLGGTIIFPATVQRSRELFKGAIVTTIYGMTESGVIASGIGNDKAVGWPAPGVRVRIVDEKGENLGHNQIGEVYAHTGETWKGYFENPEETSRMQDPEGWFHTGDLGYFDERHYLYLVDRRRSTLKYQYVHYWPGEIENVISELKEVQNVCVVGIHNELTGDEAGALVVTKKESVISAKDIIDHVARRLPGVHRQLHAGVQFTEELPVNPNGKTDRKAARDIFIALIAAAKL
nr:luciferin 4-monooxygenase-like [Drosophila takahashii]